MILKLKKDGVLKEYPIALDKKLIIHDDDEGNVTVTPIGGVTISDDDSGNVTIHGAEDPIYLTHVPSEYITE